MRHKLLIIASICCALCHVHAQEGKPIVISPAQCEGINMPYIYYPQEYTPVPEGYSPVYISHLGRHGSRNPSSGKPAENVYAILKKADAEKGLTPAGKQLLSDISRLCHYVNGGWGELSPLGERQHAEIARRMIENYPSIFESKKEIFATATWYPRCINSMDAFLGSIYRAYPDMNITTVTGKVNNPTLRFFDINKTYLNYIKKGKWRKEYQDFLNANIDSVRLTQSIFTPSFLNSIPKKQQFAIDLFGIASIMSNIDIHIDLSSYFSPEEYKAHWESQNIRRYHHRGASPQSDNIAINIAYLLLKDIIDRGDDALKNEQKAADLRFAHAETIMPLVGLMGIKEGAASVGNVYDIKYRWNDYNISPMAANMQWIFFRNNAGDVLVKVLLNEKEVALPLTSATYPYYKWEDIKKYYLPLVAKLGKDPKVKIDTSLN